MHASCFFCTGLDCPWNLKNFLHPSILAGLSRANLMQEVLQTAFSPPSCFLVHLCMPPKIPSSTAVSSDNTTDLYFTFQYASLFTPTSDEE